MIDYKIVPGRYPTEEETAEVRKKADINHMETIYGNFWKTFLHKNGKFYLEFDVGHFASGFVVGEITSSQYYALKNDLSLYEEIRNTIDLKKTIEKNTIRFFSGFFMQKNKGNFYEC